MDVVRNVADPLLRIDKWMIGDNAFKNCRCLVNWFWIELLSVKRLIWPIDCRFQTSIIPHALRSAKSLY
jgi:hypothetical protein